MSVKYYIKKMEKIQNYDIYKENDKRVEIYSNKFKEYILKSVKNNYIK